MQNPFITANCPSLCSCFLSIGRHDAGLLLPERQLVGDQQVTYETILR